jgi:hypothetical protein
MTITLTAACGHTIAIPLTNSKAINTQRVTHAQQCKCLCERCSTRLVATDYSADGEIDVVWDRRKGRG